MGLDLALLPMEDGMLAEAGPPPILRPGLVFSHSILQCERRSNLFAAIMDAVARVEQPVPEDFDSYLSRGPEYEEPHYGITSETPYGERLTWVLVSDLMPFGAHEGVLDNQQNQAVWAYLAARSPGLPIALYWH